MKSATSKRSKDSHNTTRKRIIRLNTKKDNLLTVRMNKHEEDIETQSEQDTKAKNQNGNKKWKQTRNAEKTNKKKNKHDPIGSSAQ